MTLPARRWKAWAADAAEHALRAFAGATLAALPVTSDNLLSIESFLEWQPWSVGLGSAVLSLLTSLAARRRGAPNSASVRKPKPEVTHRLPQREPQATLFDQDEA